MIRRVLLLALLAWGGVLHAQSPFVRLDDAGPGAGPAILAQALAGPHTVIPPGDSAFIIARGQERSGTIIVLGRNAIVEGRVRGDVIVVAGDLYTHPGAAIAGRAIAYGGGVYESMLATIGGQATAYRDFTYDVTAIPGVPGGYSLRYRELLPHHDAAALTWPGIFGFALPAYDRSNGLSLGGGPHYVVPGTPIVLDPRLTYRSQLGKVDPSMAVEAQLDRRTLLRGRVERTTASNDRWIRPDVLNSASFFLVGDDARNYYRATVGEATLARTWPSATALLAPYVGVRIERGNSVRPGPAATGGPWTLLSRNDPDRDDRLRPNPPIDDRRTISSALAGAAWTWNDQGIAARARADVEVGSSLAQLTFDGQIDLPTFRTHRLRIVSHAVTSLTGNTPRQRYAWLGGPGTMPTMRLLAEGGDELFYAEANYDIPLGMLKLPFFAGPVLSLHEALGGARIGSFPTLHQVTGARLGIGPVYLEFLIDPVTRKTHNGAGLSLIR